MGRYLIEERPDWRWWVTPKPLKTKPIHRWYIFPHSFTSELVHALIDEWRLSSDDYILDIFAGAGTTLLAAKEKHIPASGYDLSPLAVLATRTKIANYSMLRITKAWEELSHSLSVKEREQPTKQYSDLVKKALPGNLLGAFEQVTREINSLPYLPKERDFFLLALLSILPHFSRAVATGGWLKWEKKHASAKSLLKVLANRVSMMLQDLEKASLSKSPLWQVAEADSRRLPDPDLTYSAVITSPPYPNRHDYTRVFGVELMFGFLNWEETRTLRYQTFHSHPEAHPERPNANEYESPRLLLQSLKKLNDSNGDVRIAPMLQGYFLDMYLCLREAHRVCRKGGKVAFVVGMISVI